MKFKNPCMKSNRKILNISIAVEVVEGCFKVVEKNEDILGGKTYCCHPEDLDDLTGATC